MERLQQGNDVKTSTLPIINLGQARIFNQELVEVNDVLPLPLLNDPDSYMRWAREPTTAALQPYPCTSRRL